MYDNNNYNFDYDGVAELYEFNPSTPVKKKLLTMPVREYAEWQQDASFVGGISSLGVVYALATNEPVDISKIKPYKCQLVCDGIEYKVLSVRQHHASIGGLNNYKKAEKETVFFLG